MGIEIKSRLVPEPSREYLSLQKGDLIIGLSAQGRIGARFVPLDACKGRSAGVVEGSREIFLPPGTVASIETEDDALLLKHLPKKPGKSFGLLLVLFGGEVVLDRRRREAMHFMIGEKSKDFLGDRYFDHLVGRLRLKGQFLR